MGRQLHEANLTLKVRSDYGIGRAKPVQDQDPQIDAALLGDIINNVPMARALIAEMGSLDNVFAAPPARLKSIPGMTNRILRQLSATHDAALSLTRAKFDRTMPVLSSRTQLLAYLHVAMAYEPVEQLRLLFLNQWSRLIADEVQQTGTVNHTPMYVREVIKRALDLSATGLIMVHNHPSGDPSPSASDVRMTQQIVKAGEIMGVRLMDHLIIGRFGHVSMQEMGLLQAS